MRSAAAADRPRIRAWSGFALAMLAGALPVLAAEPAAKPNVPYAVQVGDDCKIIAKQFWPELTSEQALDKLHALNPQLGPTPHHLKPGMVLTVQPLDAPAHLTFLKPDVNKRAERQPDWQPAERGDGLFRLDQVNTLRGAGAEITFHDESAVQLDENALIVIYGDVQKQKVSEKTGAIELMQGDAAVSLSALRGEKPLEVKTPAGQIALHGASKEGSRIGVDREKTSRVSVFHGDASVSAKGRSVAVKSGFGTRVEKGKVPEAPTPLPSSPRWSSEAPVRRFAFAEAIPFALSFEKVERAVHYRVQLARDAAFNDRALDRTLDADVLQLQAELPPGAYRARVWATDAKGLEGAPSSEREVQLVSAHAQGGAPDASGVLRGKAEATIQLELAGPPELPIALDGEAPIALSQRHTFTFDRAGKHTLAFSAATLSIEIDAPPPPPPAPAALPPPPPPPLPPPPAPRAIPEVGQTRGPLGSANAVTGGTGLPTGFLERGFTAQLRLQPEFSAPANRSKVMLGAVDVEADTGAIAVFASGTLQGNPGPGSALGFPTIGLRGRLLGDADLALTIGGDVSFGIAGSADGLEVPRARAWVAGAWRTGPFSLSTTQAVTPATYGSGYEGALVGGYLFCPGFLVQAELDADGAGLCPAGDCLAGAASLGVRGRWRIFEGGAALRTGLGTEGRQFWGQPAAIFTLGVHLGGRDWIVSP